MEKQRRMEKIVRLLLSLLVVLCVAGEADAKKSKHRRHAHPNKPMSVLVTVKPIHSLVAGIMEGIAEPALLIDSDASPHTHQLKPSEEQKLNSATVIIWVGDIYESALKNRIANVSDSAYIITLSEDSNVQLLPYRRFKNSPDDGECDPAEHSCGEGHHHELKGKDGHLWLAPNVAKVLVAHVAQELAALDRGNAPRYLANSKKVIARLEALNRELAAELKSVKGQPYLLFHDFMHYFDRAYGTKCVGVIRLNPAIAPSPRHMRNVKEEVQASKGSILFTEPQFDSKSIKGMAWNLDVATAQLDYLGYGLDTGPDLYFEMMRRLASDVKKGLESRMGPKIPTLGLNIPTMNVNIP